MTQTKRMRVHLILDLKPRTNLDGTSGKNLADRLVGPAQKLFKSVIETSGKVWEPKTYDEAMNDPIYGHRWREAINKELWDLDIHQTWYYTSLPDNRKAIGSVWMFRVKYNLDVFIERYKMRLVVQRFFQIHEINNIEIFSLTIKCESLRTSLAIAAMLIMILIQMDVVDAYLKSALSQNK